MRWKVIPRPRTWGIRYPHSTAREIAIYISGTAEPILTEAADMLRLIVSPIFAAFVTTASAHVTAGIPVTAPGQEMIVNGCLSVS